VTDDRSSYRRILKSSLVIGGSSTTNILISVVRTKILAILIGAGGIGLIALYSAAMSALSGVFSMGLGTAGTREVAATCDDHGGRQAIVRRALFATTFVLAAAAGLLVWFGSDFLSHLAGSQVDADAMRWLAVGVCLSVATTSQAALIQGMRRIGDMAKIAVLGSAVSSALGVALIWRWGAAAILPYVISGPIIGFLISWAFVLRLPKPPAGAIRIPELARIASKLLRLGAAFVAAGLVSSLVTLWIRVHVGKTLGTEAVGHLQAAWAISMQYIGFVLGAMSADFYPRLTAQIEKPEAAAAIINEQTEIALLLCAPIFIAVMAAAPAIIQLLYASDFGPAADVLRWQILGDVLKVVAWPLGFVMLAAGDGKTFFWLESASYLVMGAAVWLLVPYAGLSATGISFAVCYCFYLPAVYLLGRRRIGFRWSVSVVRYLSITLVACVSSALVAHELQWGWLVGCCMALVFFFHALARVAKLSKLGGGVRWVARLAKGLGVR
jgi:PST family polysaccharide transporter